MNMLIIIVSASFLSLFILVWMLFRNKNLATENATLRTQLEEKEKYMLFLQGDFQKLATDILRSDSEGLQQQNNALLEPLKQDIEKFKTRLEDINKSQSNERVELKKQIEMLELSNKDILQNAKNLTDALTYDNKKQGNWGEMQLELILQGSGLREGFEYHKQQGHRGEDGKLYKPDFIVHLPGEKDIIIDSKVSLKDYTRYINGENSALSAHIKSVQTHINNISLKVYENLEGVSSLDFIFVFFPIEASLLLVLEQDPELFTNAMKKNIALVSPSTLMMSLKVVAHIWNIEKQNKNTEEIVRLAGRMYDKLANFVTDLDKVKKGLDNATQSYEDAKRKLSGHDNAIGIAEKIKTLGVSSKKQIND